MLDVTVQWLFPLHWRKTKIMAFTNLHAYCKDVELFFVAPGAILRYIASVWKSLGTFLGGIQEVHFAGVLTLMTHMSLTSPDRSQEFLQLLLQVLHLTLSSPESSSQFGEPWPCSVELSSSARAPPSPLCRSWERSDGSPSLTDARTGEDVWTT